MRAKTSLILPLILACAAWAQTPPAPQKTPTGDTATPAKIAPKAPAGKTKAAAPHTKAASKQAAGKTTAAKTPAKAAQKAPAKTAVAKPKTAPTKPAAAAQTKPVPTKPATASQPKPAPVGKQPAAASKAKVAPAAPASKTATAAPQAKTAPSKAIAPQKKPAPVAKQGVGTPKSKSVAVAKQPFGAPRPKTAAVAKKSTPTKTKAATKPAAGKSLTAKSSKRSPRQPKLKGKAVAPSSKPAPAPVQRAATVEERLRPGLRRDPFISPVIRVGNVTPCTTGGKKCLAIGDIVLKGVAKTENGMLAVVENSARKAYFLRENDPVFNGFVVKITMDEVVLRESVMDRVGHTSTRDVIKKVNPSPVG